MLTRNFTFCTDEERNYQGLKADWMPNADPANGLGCMHDMLEHFQSQTTALEGECEAIGALLFLRLENGWASSRRSVRSDDWAVMGRELSSCLIDAVDHALTLPVRLRTPTLAVGSEETLQRALDEAFRVAFGELAYRDDDSRAQALRQSGLREAFASWVRRGYRRAVRRFEGIDTYWVSDVMFPRVGRALDKLIESDVLAEGDKIGVSLNLRELAFYVRVNGLPVNEMYDL